MILTNYFYFIFLVKEILAIYNKNYVMYLWLQQNSLIIKFSFNLFIIITVATMKLIKIY